MRQWLAMGLCAALGVIGGCGERGDSCRDLIFDGNETDLDCGGSCAPCVIGEGCIYDRDCTTGSCVARVCRAAATCTDNVQNADESDIDCGGADCPRCGDGRACLAPSDCASGSCMSGRCIDASFPVVDPADVYQIDPTAGLVISAGSQAGYGVLGGNGSYRVVWVGDGSGETSYHEFYGSIYTAGIFSSVTAGCSMNACVFPSADYLSQPYDINGGQRVDFDSFAATSDQNIYGFDIVASDGNGAPLDPIYMELYVDGQSHPELIFFTSPDGNVYNPVAIPFGLGSN